MKISVLIPTLNAGPNWITLLESLRSQDVFIDKKIIIDSGSTDATVELALQFGFEILTIKKNDFDHGYARQLLAEASKDLDILIYLTQDSILSDSTSINNLIRAFDNENVALAYGRQLPRKGAKTLETHARLFNYPEASMMKSFEDKERLGIKTASCSNSFAAYRKSMLFEVGGFPSQSIFGEDVIVGGKLLMVGKSIAYVGDARVYHSHDYTIIEEFKRYFDIGVFHSNSSWLLDNFGSADGEGLKYLKSELKYVLKNNIFMLPKMVASIFAKYSGYKLGLRHKHFSKKINQRISMHKKHWIK